MADGFHINGPCLLYPSTGPGGSLELLGYTVDGVDVQVTHNLSEVMTDVMGPMTPHDLQDMGEVAVVTCPLMVSYRDCLKRVMGRGDKPAEGTLNSPGLLLGQSGASFLLGVTSPGDEPYLFDNVVWRPDARVKLSTKAQPFVIQFFGWPRLPFTATTGRGARLYSRSF